MESLSHMLLSAFSPRALLSLGAQACWLPSPPGFCLRASKFFSLCQGTSAVFRSLIKRSMSLPRFHPQIKGTVPHHTLAASFIHFVHSLNQQVFIAHLFSALCLRGARDVTLGKVTVQCRGHSVKPPYKTVGLKRSKNILFFEKKKKQLFIHYQGWIRMKIKAVPFNLK